MTHSTKMVTELASLGSVLAHGKLKVPPYQRTYAWESGNVDDLLKDLAEAIRTNQAEYFLGAMVLTEKASADDEYEVVDGQQRLATTAIILAAARDYFVETSDTDRAADLERSYLLTRDLRTQETGPHLRLSDADNDYFAKRILLRPGAPERNIVPSRESHRRLDAAAVKIRSYLKAIVAASKSPTELVISWIEYLEHRAKVIVVRVPTQTNAFVVFETLNDRGLELSAADLIKNFIFMKSENRLGESQQAWSKMIGVLEAIENQDITLTFIRHYWLASRGEARAKELFAVVRAETGSKQAAVDLAHGLLGSAKQYAAIVNPDSAFWNAYGDTSRGHMKTINLLRMEQIRPLVLAILTSFEKKEVGRALHLMISWGVRFLVVGGLGGGTLEKFYGDLARKVTNKSIGTAKGLASSGVGMVPTDPEFEAEFAVARVSQAWLARYYLRALESQRRGEDEPELVPNDNADQITLEHVLPQNPDSSWAGLSDEQRGVLVKRIGNLALLSKEANNSTSNDFVTKKLIYKASEYELTKEIAKTKDWGESAITQRQKALAKQALLVWPLKV